MPTRVSQNVIFFKWILTKCQLMSTRSWQIIELFGWLARKSSRNFLSSFSSAIGRNLNIPRFRSRTFGGRPFVLVPDPSHGICPWDRWEADGYVEKAMQNDASHLSYGEIKHTQVKKNKNMKFGTLNCPEPGQISSYRGLRGTIRRIKMRSFFWEGSQGARKPSRG